MTDSTRTVRTVTGVLLGAAFVVVAFPLMGAMHTAPTDSLAGPMVADSAVYAQACAMCHGAAGAGDGPAGAAFNPPVPDFTTAEFQDGRTDEALAAAIADGNGGMPAYGAQYSAEQIAGLVAYIRGMKK